jgi:hypothetical protein
MDEKVLKEIHDIQEIMGVEKVAAPILKAFKMNVPEEMTEVEEGEMTEQYKIPTFKDGDIICDVFCGKKAMRKGSTGDAVKMLQQALIDCGFELPKFGVDGDYGSETVQAVLKYQNSRENITLKDGVIGPETMRALQNDECASIEGWRLDMCKCNQKKSLEPGDEISDLSPEQRKGRDAADKYEKEQRKKREEEMMKKLPIKGDGYECEKCPSYVNRMPGPRRKELTKFEAWCINNCDTKVVV